MNRLLTKDLQYPSPTGFVNWGQLFVWPTKKRAFSWDSAAIGVATATSAGRNSKRTL